jgi:5-methylcytosine-specific restriction endonuclease McrA
VDRFRDAKRAQQYTAVNPDRIPIAKLIKRDKGVCYHCKKLVDTSVVAPAPMAPTRDHFIPLAKGGPHTWDNIVLAHFHCNSEKRDVMPSVRGQMVMFAI